ncbi:RsmF rRNA methyltransferase first C-terminal domain-containing protein [Brevibacillus fluminis]|uniref:RsmF rRNA methyltransferase first C-terminal domain-containing protein n=1 Tax=Brevibacillus fluminis TaxID=511487 RepID=UPI003F898B21
MKALPQRFVQRMESLLDNQYDAFLHSYTLPAWQGLRVNPLKLSHDSGHLQASLPFSLTPVPWCPTGFTYAGEERPGKHPYHACGLYYLQEPSAMAAAEALDVLPGDTILDLCAAPGGKSTQIAGMMQGKGLLVTNEIHPARVKALAENIERLGVTNAIVTNETPERLMERFPLFFDHILVDAPCSGEGMFRKLPEAIEDWSEDKVAECGRMQQDILEAAAHMLKPGGVLVYSTCTFAPLENEQSIASFLLRHPEFAIESINHHALFSPGEADWAAPPLPALRQTARLWPHRLHGEGHYIARIRKQSQEGIQGIDGDAPVQVAAKKQKKPAKPAAGLAEAIGLWNEFAREALPGLSLASTDPSAYILFGEQLYMLPQGFIDLSGIKVARAGWHLGTVKKGRFEPSHALALGCRPADAARTADFAASDADVLRYLKGESLTRSGQNGWTIVTVDGFALGWGKQVDEQLKNHYPKGLRWL